MKINYNSTYYYVIMGIQINENIYLCISCFDSLMATRQPTLLIF